VEHQGRGSVALRFQIRRGWRAEIGPNSRAHALGRLKSGSEAFGSLPTPKNERETREKDFELEKATPIARAGSELTSR